MKLFHKYKIPIYLSKDNLIITYVISNNKKLVALIDTGSNHSIINTTLAEELCPINTKEFNANMNTLLVSNSINTYTTLELNFRINKNNYSNDFIMMNLHEFKNVTEPFDLILGTDFLLKYKPLLSFKPIRK